MTQLELIVDLGAYDLPGDRKTRPSRHAGRQGRLSCGHKMLPHDGQYKQYPLTFSALIQTVDCQVCKKYLAAQAVMKVIKSRATVSPVSNTGVNYATTGVETHDCG